MKTLLNLTGEFALPDLPILDDVQEVLEPAAPLDLSDEAAVAVALAGYAFVPNAANLIVLLPDETAAVVVRRALPGAYIVTLDGQER